MIRRIILKIESYIIRFFHPEIKKLQSEGLTYLSGVKLVTIKKTIRSLEEKKVPGVFIGTGCALGGSAILIGLNKAEERKLFIYDVFGMIPPPSEKDEED